MEQSKKQLIIHQLNQLTKTDLSELVLLQQNSIVELKEQVETLTPKADFYDAVVDSKTDSEMSEVAKVLNVGMGRNKIFKRLREMKILRYNNEPYQEYCDRGYFRQIEQKVTLPYGETLVNFKTVVSQKGIDYIRKILTGDKWGR